MQSEYIKREDALNEAYSERVGEDEFSSFKEIILVKDILAIPAADVVEVVRCKDCKWREDRDGEVAYYCKNHQFTVGSDFFCREGKRKDGDAQ
jgi:hypothetical protein